MIKVEQDIRITATHNDPNVIEETIRNSINNLRRELEILSSATVKQLTRHQIEIKEEYTFYLNREICDYFNVAYFDEHCNIIHYDALQRFSRFFDNNHRSILAHLKGDILFKRSEKDAPGHFTVSLFERC